MSAPVKRRQPPALQAVTAYLDNWAMRRAGTGSPTVFDRPDTDVIVALLHLELLRRFTEPVPRAAARADVERHVHLDGTETGPTANIGGYALVAAARAMGEAPDTARLAELMRAGGGEDALSTLIGLAWRAALLAELLEAGVAPDGAEDELGVLRPRLARASVAIDGEGLAARADNPGAAGRLAHGLALAGDGAGVPECLAAAARLVGVARERIETDGATVHTAHVAQVVVGAAACGDRALAARLAGALLAERLHDGRGMLRALPGEEKLETSAWTPLALACGAPDVTGLHTVFDPPAPEPPDYEIADVRAHADGLDFVLRRDGREAVRRFTVADFDLLLAEMLDQLAATEAGELSPRLHGHVAIGLMEVADRTEHPETRAALETQIDRSLEEILGRQEPSGGWQYARKAPSVIYSAGSASASEFPDHQYTIDAAVPGIALSLQHRRRADPRHLAACERAFAFLEQDVGRVDWDGRPVWRLYPSDEKTEKQGTAVNYEVWVGFFLASLSGITDDEGIRERARGYIDDIVAYTATHLHDTGDIGYGDYVRELRTPYASWDAYLLAEIDRFAGHPRAREMAERIVRRLGEVQLPSGAVPNIVDYQEWFGPLRRWRVHRHGVGPYPLRAYYLLYFVGAAAAARTAQAAALRAWGFVLVENFRPTFGDMSTGYFADGRFDERADSLARVGRDWLLVAIAATGDISGLDYRPDLTRIVPDRDRYLALVTDTWTQAATALAAGATDQALRDLAQGRAALRSTGDDGAQRLLADSDEPPPPSEPPPRKTKTDHPARWAETLAVLVAAGEEPGTDLSVAGLLALQGDSGLWPMRHRPDGDERQADVLVALLDLLEARPDLEAVSAAITRGAEGAWRELFNERTGAAYARPGIRTPMRGRLAFRHLEAFARAGRLGLFGDAEARVRLALRHALLTRTAWDGRIDVAADPDAPAAGADAQLFRAVATVYAELPDLVVPGASVDGV